MYQRRNFIKKLTVSSLSPFLALSSSKPKSSILKPKRLRVGDTVGLVSPAGFISNSQLQDTADQLLQMGLRVKYGQHVLDKYGYLAGHDRDRATDINNMFRDSSVDAILAVRGGWGCARLLAYLDYEMIRENPKILMGYSDITALLIALNAIVGLVTFHGPVGISSWNDFTMSYLNNVLFEGKAIRMLNDYPPNDGGTTTQTITRGQAIGKLTGGNLSVLDGMVGSPYVPDWKGKILFVEEIGEDVYRVDRMLTHLKIAGVLSELSGFIFGSCTDCSTAGGSLSLMQVLQDHIAPLGIPAWYGSMIGHINDKFTIPIGSEVRINANEGIIEMLETAVN